MVNSVGLMVRNTVANGISAFGNRVATLCDNGAHRMVESVKGAELQRIAELEDSCDNLCQQNGELRDELEYYKDKYDQASSSLEPLWEENNGLREQLKQVPSEWTERVTHAENVLVDFGVPHDSDVCYVLENGEVYHLDKYCSSIPAYGLRVSSIRESTVGVERCSRRVCKVCGGELYKIASVEAFFGIEG